DAPAARSLIPRNWSESRTSAGRAAAAGGGAVGSGWAGGLADGCWEFSGGGVDGLDGDLVAEALQTSEVVAGLAADAGAAFVVVGAEVGVRGLRVREQGVVDGQQGVAGGDEGFLLGHPLDQAPVLRAREGLGAS